MDKGTNNKNRKYLRCPSKLFWQPSLTLLHWLHRADSINRPGGDSVHGVQRGTRLGKVEWIGNKQNMREKEGMHGLRMETDSVVRRPVLSCTELTVCFSMLMLRAPVFVYVCPLHGH